MEYFAELWGSFAEIWGCFCERYLDAEGEGRDIEKQQVLAFG